MSLSVIDYRFNPSQIQGRRFYLNIKVSPTHNLRARSSMLSLEESDTIAVTLFTKNENDLTR